MSEDKPVVILNHYERNLGSAGSDDSNYRGLRIHALPGLHEAAAALIRSKAMAGTTRQRAVDIGAGAGALSLRLSDMGFDVTAVDYFREGFTAVAEGITFRQFDCNLDFAEELEQDADVVTALEIIEHLENPRHFLRQCTALLKPGGFLILSTPNIDSARSKADFVREGNFHMFRDVSYRTIGHITPISTWQIYKMVKECNLDVLHHSTCCEANYKFRERPRMYTLQTLVRALAPRTPWGDAAVHLLALQKGRAPANLVSTIATEESISNFD